MPNHTSLASAPPHERRCYSSAPSHLLLFLINLVAAHPIITIAALPHHLRYNTSITYRCSPSHQHRCCSSATSPLPFRLYCSYASKHHPLEHHHSSRTSSFAISDHQHSSTSSRRCSSVTSPLPFRLHCFSPSHCHPSDPLQPNTVARHHKESHGLSHYRSQWQTPPSPHPNAVSTPAVRDQKPYHRRDLQENHHLLQKMPPYRRYWFKLIREGKRGDTEIKSKTPKGRRGGGGASPGQKTLEIWTCPWVIEAFNFCNYLLVHKWKSKGRVK